MIIRKANSSDKVQLEKLLRGFYVEDKKRFSPKLQEWEQYKNQEDVIKNTADKYLSDNKFIVYVADESRILMGYICGEVINKNHKIYDKEGYVQDWFVEKDAREKKIGKRLFYALIEEFKEMKCTHIALHSFVENKKAINIYHGMGFKDELLVMRKDFD